MFIVHMVIIKQVFLFVHIFVENFIISMKNFLEIFENKFLFLSIHNAINLFEKARPPGITNQDYLNKLVQKFERNNLISTDIHQVKFIYQGKI